MKGTVIFFAIAIAAGYALYAKPWQPTRYDDSVQGQQAKKIDNIVDKAPPNIWEARAMLAEEPTLQGQKIYSEFSPLVESLYAAGASNVSFAYIKSSVRVGDGAEGLYAVLPKDATKRKALIALAAGWPHPPKEVNQKYIYLRIRGWDVDQPERSFLGN